MSGIKPKMKGPQASRADLAHLSIDQFSTGVSPVLTSDWTDPSEAYDPGGEPYEEPSGADASAEAAYDVMHNEHYGRKVEAEHGANQHWEGAKSYVGPGGSFSGYGGGQVYYPKSTMANTKPHQVEGLVRGDPRAMSDVGKRNRVWQTNAEQN